MGHPIQKQNQIQKQETPKSKATAGGLYARQPLSLQLPLTWVPHPLPVLQRVGLLNFGFAFACVAAEPVPSFGTGSGMDPGGAKSNSKSTTGGREARRYEGAKQNRTAKAKAPTLCRTGKGWGTQFKSKGKTKFKNKKHQSQRQRLAGVKPAATKSRNKTELQEQKLPPFAKPAKDGAPNSKAKPNSKTRNTKVKGKGWRA